MKTTNETAPIVHEYFNRKLLAKLGYTSDIGRLSEFKAGCFMFIASEVNKLEQEEMKRNRRR